MYCGMFQWNYGHGLVRIFRGFSFGSTSTGALEVAGLTTFCELHLSRRGFRQSSAAPGM